MVVTGHMADEVQAALKGAAVRIVHNPNFAEGLATSVRKGIAAVEPIYTLLDAMAALTQFVPHAYQEWFEPAAGIRMRYWNAGHKLRQRSHRIQQRVDRLNRCNAFARIALI